MGFNHQCGSLDSNDWLIIITCGLVITGHSIIYLLISVHTVCVQTDWDVKFVLKDGDLVGSFDHW